MNNLRVPCLSKGQRRGLTKAIGLGMAAAALALAPMSAQASTFQLLHTFGAAPDGTDPTQPLVARAGTVFGATCKGGTFNQGTTFKIKPNGTQYLKLHDFDPAADGICPSDLKFHGSMFYGTTVDGGFGSKDGAIFQMLPATPWTVTALYGFGVSAADGQISRAGVIFHAGKMFGTTQSGNAISDGTVFRYDFSTETPIHSFGGTDGSGPKSALVYANGSLWGTTTTGTGSASLGTVFRMNTSGVITWQYSFTGGSDGATPSSRLLHVGPYLYGVARSGGAGPCSCGTIYKIDPASPTAAIPVYSFAGGTNDGDTPSGNLAVLGGVLYGTTEAGGGSGNGTVYGVDPATSLQPNPPYSLNGSADGSQPMSGLLRRGSWFYGTASTGGSSNNGTVFRFHP